MEEPIVTQVATGCDYHFLEYDRYFVVERLAQEKSGRITAEVSVQHPPGTAIVITIKVNLQFRRERMGLAFQLTRQYQEAIPPWDKYVEYVCADCIKRLRQDDNNQPTTWSHVDAVGQVGDFPDKVTAQNPWDNLPTYPTKSEGGNG